MDWQLSDVPWTKEDSKPLAIIGHHWKLPIELVVVVVERIGEWTTNSSIDTRASSRKSYIEPVPKITNLMTASILAQDCVSCHS